MTQQIKSKARQMTHLRLSTILSKLADASDRGEVEIIYRNSGPRTRRYLCVVVVRGTERYRIGSNYDLAARRLAYELHLIPRSEINPQGGTQ